MDSWDTNNFQNQSENFNLTWHLGYNTVSYQLTWHSSGHSPSDKKTKFSQQEGIIKQKWKQFLKISQGSAQSFLPGFPVVTIMWGEKFGIHMSAVVKEFISLVNACFVTLVGDDELLCAAQKALPCWWRVCWRPGLLRPADGVINFLILQAPD